MGEADFDALVVRLAAVVAGKGFEARLRFLRDQAEMLPRAKGSYAGPMLSPASRDRRSALLTRAV